LVKGMRVAGARGIEEANAYLEGEFLPWWNRTLAVKPAEAADAHRPLGKEHDLAAILSHVEQRQVTNDYSVRYDGKVYQIRRPDIRAGMRRAMVRVEERWDGSIAVQFQGRYVEVSRCAAPLPGGLAPKAVLPKQPQPAPASKRKSDWMKGFSIRSGASLREAIEASNARG